MMKPSVRLVSGVAILSSLAIMVAHGVARGEAPRLSASQEGKVAQDTRSFAGANGESVPVEMRAVLTTRQKAVDLIMHGDRVDSDDSAILVLARGHFIGYQMEQPPQVASASGPPKGDVLLIVYDARTGRLLDWTLRDTMRGDRLPNLPSLGAVTSLAPSN